MCIRDRLLGYNKLAAKADADVVISWKGDPILALDVYKRQDGG